MGQLGFFDAALASLISEGRSARSHRHLMPWESFAPRSRRWCSHRTSSRKRRRPEAVRCHSDVQDAGSTSAQQSVGRADGISGARPAVIFALFWGRSDSGVPVGPRRRSKRSKARNCLTSCETIRVNLCGTLEGLAAFLTSMPQVPSAVASRRWRIRTKMLDSNVQGTGANEAGS